MNGSTFNSLWRRKNGIKVPVEIIIKEQNENELKHKFNLSQKHMSNISHFMMNPNPTVPEN